MAKKRKYLGAPLREVLDADLIEALEKLSDGSKAEIVRTGARIVLGITSHKVTEVHSRPVPRPTIFIQKSIRN
ncbi:hypothetical protein [Gorillibacterium sp. sgz5001074]|uniref:hypothetical protein n=1 Tax=Gorillibacterium sp. sgz5001074 TaxID=3446695 RepID=UPI003F677F55